MTTGVRGLLESKGKADARFGTSGSSPVKLLLTTLGSVSELVLRGWMATMMPLAVLKAMVLFHTSGALRAPAGVALYEAKKMPTRLRTMTLFRIGPSRPSPAPELSLT